MRIVIVSEWFSEKMGYVENHLPAALARQGHDVHLVTTDLQVYATFPEMYDKVYRHHLGPPVVPTGVFRRDGYVLHRLRHSRSGGLSNPGLAEALAKIAPDVVYCFEIMTPDYEVVAEHRRSLGYRIFCESRLHTSVLRAPKGLWRKVGAWFRRRRSIRLAAEVTLFYPIAPDVRRNIVELLGVPEDKCKSSSLAVDVGTFRKDETPGARVGSRESLGYGPDDIVCVYTGRFVEDKGPLLLAEALRRLHEAGHTNFKALFVGNGEPDVIGALSARPGCRVHPFVSQSRLAEIYNACDIGVWPKQESTSQLDAAACGLPLVLDAAVEDKWRTDNSGLTYAGGAEGLAACLLRLESREYREKLGEHGRRKIAEAYSWDKLAADKLKDFTQALAAGAPVHG